MKDPGEVRDYDHLWVEHQHAVEEIVRLRLEVRVLRAELEASELISAYRAGDKAL